MLFNCWFLDTLDGCHSDASRMYKFIIKTYGFVEANVVLLLDDPRLKPEYQPTRANIVCFILLVSQDSTLIMNLRFTGCNG